MSSLRVRAYNVRFGDAILITVPDKSGNRVTTRHILIDVGNVLSGPGSDEGVFEPVVKDILKELKGKPLDLYVMTHEHMDHVKGLLYAKQKHGLEIKATHAWITGSAQEGYYDQFPNAAEKRRNLLESYDAISRYLAATPKAQSPWIRAMLANNNPRDTGNCVEYLSTLAEKTSYVYRGCELNGTHPFNEAEFEIWAPEEDTSDYYGRFQPMSLGLVAGVAGEGAAVENPMPPHGVDAGAFFDLVKARRRGWGDNLLAIDKAANNTSVVFCLTWRGIRLLFPGDAEQRSWKTMGKNGMLKPVHFLKVGHHGSHNGTPPTTLLDELLPLPSPDGVDRYAVLCTCLDCYSGVPDSDTSSELERRCTVSSVQNVNDGEYVDIEFPG